MSKQRRIVAFVLIGMLVLSIVVAFTAWPHDKQPDDLVDSEALDAPVGVLITLDSIDPARGVVHLSVQAAGTDEIGPEGATLVTDIPGISTVSLPQSNFAAPVTAEMAVDGADVSQYPFDGYPFDIAMAAFKGDVKTATALSPDAAQVPVEVRVVSTLSGFEARAEASLIADSVTSVSIHLERQSPTVAWAVAMMVVYWLLAASALAVAVAILTGVRPFETRHLAWLTATIFAFAAFRNTAPGAPPIGVFLDFAAFFWAVGIVVLAELLILGYYLFASRDRTEPI